MEQLKGIYLGDVTNWKEVGGPDAPIVLYSRENSSGTYVFFKEHVLKGEDFAATAQTLPGTAAVVNAVSKEKNGIGYGGAAYAKGVKEVKVVGQDGQGYLPNAENVKSGKYPLSRPLFMYTRAAPAGEVKEFIDFCLSAGGPGDRDQGRLLPGQVTSASPDRHARATETGTSPWRDPSPCEPSRTPRRRAERPPAPAMRRRQLREAAIEIAITLVALTGIAAVVLIFVFVAREALPLFRDPEVAKEVDLGRMFLPQVWREGRPAVVHLAARRRTSRSTR